MKKITQRELDLMIEKHQHWIKKDREGWEEMKANLSDTDLSGLTLDGANLQCVNFSRASLRDTDMAGADLSWTTFINADMTGADLTDADFSGSWLNGANLRNARIRKTRFHEADMDKANMKNTYAAKSSFCKARLSRTCLSGAVFRNCTFAEAVFYYADLRQTDFSGNGLQNVKFANADMAGTVFKNANLHWASFKNNDIAAADTKNADMSGVIFEDTVASEKILSAFSLSDARIDGLDLQECTPFVRACIHEKASWNTRVVDCLGWNLDTERTTAGCFPWHTSVHGREKEEIEQIADRCDALLYYRYENTVIVGGMAFAKAVKAGILDERFEKKKRVGILRCETCGIGEKEASEIARKLAVKIAGLYDWS